jgi:queuine/archaeosine tRNA-ribosyltransferase
MMDEYINRIIDYFESEAIPKNYNSTLKYMDIEKILTEYEQDLEQVKQILNEFTESQMSQNETLAYLNHLHDVTDCKVFSMMQIHDIFGCYF